MDKWLDRKFYEWSELSEKKPDWFESGFKICCDLSKPKCVKNEVMAAVSAMQCDISGSENLPINRPEII